jgi:hypothetical protein
LGRPFGTENVDKVFFSDSPPFPSYDASYNDVPFIVVIVDFYKMETVRSRITCKFISLFAMNERKKERKPILLLFEYFSVRIVRNFQTCYRYYCPSMITALQLCVLPRNLCPEAPSNDLGTSRIRSCEA